MTLEDIKRTKKANSKLYRVLRYGEEKEITIASAELVVGDIVILEKD